MKPGAWSSVVGEVERDLRARDRHRDRDPVAPGGIEAVGDHPALAVVRAVGPAPKLGAHLAFGGVDDVVHVRVEALDAVAFEHVDEAALADRARADHRLDVLGDDLEPDVRPHEVPDVAAQLPAIVDLQRRDAERLLPDLPRARVIAARRHAADVRDVALARAPRDELTVVEDRQEDADVRVLVAAAVDVVVEDHVAVVQVVAEVLDDPLQRRLRAVGDDRRVLGLGERAAAAVEDHRHQIADLVEDRRPRGAHQHRRHLAGDRLHAALQDGSEDRIRAGHAMHQTTARRSVSKSYGAGRRSPRSSTSGTSRSR